MNKKGDNKIGIPWYRRTVKGIGNLDDMGNNPISFTIPEIPKPNTRPKLQPEPEPKSIRVPQTSPVKSPVFEPNPIFNPNPFPNPLPFPNPFPVPLPERKPNNPNPVPAPQQPAFPALPLIPAMFTDPNYDWAKHWEEVSKNLPQPAPAPEPEKNPFQKTLEGILKPVIYLFVAREAVNQWTKVNVTDPIYNEMLKDPVLGSVLREGEKANLDAETLGTILANFDWENGDYAELEKQLAVGIGVAGAARLMIFIIGRKVVFRM